MKQFKLMIGFLVIALVIGSAADVSATKKVSEPFKYSGYTFPEYGNFTKDSKFVAMSDGVKLAVTYYTPADGPTGGPFPVLFNYLPYHRESIDPETGAERTYFDLETIQFFTSYGYVVFLADFRGSGASYGSHINTDPQIGRDGKELIEWMAEQPWCDGNVGMLGGSYHGWSQFATAGERPSALKCIMPEVTDMDSYSSGKYYPGGILNKALEERMAYMYPFYDANMLIPGILYPTIPVVDEDGDGEYHDEIPIDQDGNGFFTDDYELPGNPPRYIDGEEREHVYYNATMEHLANQGFTGGQDLRFRDAQGAGGYTFTDLSPGNFPAAALESGIPVLNFGGWFDYYTNQTAMLYATYAATNPSKLNISPIFHGGLGLIEMYNGAYVDYFGLNKAELTLGYLNERLRFADRYLKGIENGIDMEPAVTIFVMNGEGWRNESEWPLDRQVTAKLFFQADNGLSLIPSAEGSDDYTADFTHDSRQPSSGANRWNMRAQDQVDIRNDRDAKCLVYTSPPLKKDVEITGHPVVRLWVSSTANHGDFFAYLEDVHENGDAYYVTDRMHRAGFADLVPNEDMVGFEGDINVLPDLPWHGFTEFDYTDGVFADGRIVEVAFELMPTSWVFKKGHRIRIAIACADYPTFALHPDLSPNNDPYDPYNIIPTITVHRDADHQSLIELPVIPKKKMKASKESKWLAKQFCGDDDDDDDDDDSDDDDDE